VAKSKKIDLEKEISIRIEGELGKYNTLPIENLIKIAENLQNLINDIVKHDLPADDAIDPNNFKIELSGFHPGSAIPQFSFTQRINPTISDVTLQRKNVNGKLLDLLAITDSGDYKSLKKMYPDSVRRNAFVEDIYNLSNSFGNSPTSFGTLDDKGKFHSSFKNIRFKSDLKNGLIVKVGKDAQAKESEIALGKIKITKQGNKVVRQKIEQVYDKTKTSVSFSPEVINVAKKQYILNFPLRCSFEQEDDYFVIQYELLDLIGTGLTEDEAESNFNEEFDFLYTKLTSMSDKKMSKHLQRVKQIFQELVQTVKVI
jgi:hypothetical protein